MIETDILSDPTVEFTKEEMCSDNSGPRWLCPWFMLSSEWRVFLFGMCSYNFLPTSRNVFMAVMCTLNDTFAADLLNVFIILFML